MNYFLVKQHAIGEKHYMRKLLLMSIRLVVGMKAKMFFSIQIPIQRPLEATKYVTITCK
jgi:hypothetical protein